MEQLKILIVDDDQWVREELHEFLMEFKYTVFQAALPSEAFRIAETQSPDIAILDIKLPEMDGLELLERFKASSPDMEVIMMTGHGDIHNVVQAMRLGAADYLTKPFRLPEVQAAIERTGKFILLNKQLKTAELNYALLSQELGEQRGYTLIGQSRPMQSVMELMSKVAKSPDTSVLLIGESGTGKELIARGIHHLSVRKTRTFCAVNTSAVTDSLFESEFFGHRKGAFTGASTGHPGYFESAQGGTLFLDEICSMPIAHQAKLLRVLEERMIARVGSHQLVSIDVRVIAATNRHIEQLVADGSFRKDLYYRLNTFTIHVPPLRERAEDIPLLLQNFVEHYARKIGKRPISIDPKLPQALMSYHFPGNVRELKNMVERAVILCDGSRLSFQHLPDFRRNSIAAPWEADNLRKGGNLDASLDAAETRLILEALRKSGGNKTHAAGLLQISRQSLHRRMQRLKINSVQG